MPFASQRHETHLTAIYLSKSGDKILALSNKFPGIVLTGARQTGKTSLLRKVFPQHDYVSLDIPSLVCCTPQRASHGAQRFSMPIQDLAGLFL
jgi:hypothetical protein